MSETSLQVVKRYLLDALSAEHSLASHFNRFASQGEDHTASDFFKERAAASEAHRERLNARLERLGEPPASKLSISRIFGFGEKTQQFEFATNERTTLKLLIAYTTAQSEAAMYEVVAMMAEASGDTETQSLARSLQQEETLYAERAWALLAPAVQREFDDLSS